MCLGGEFMVLVLFGFVHTYEVSSEQAGEIRVSVECHRK